MLGKLSALPEKAGNRPDRHWDLGWGQFQDTLRRLEKRPPGLLRSAQTDSCFDAKSAKKELLICHKKKWTETIADKIADWHTKVSIKAQKWLSPPQIDRYGDLLIERQ